MAVNRKAENMKIRKKIIISNILMVVVPLIFAMALIFYGWTHVDRKYIYSLEKMFEDENAVMSAQSMIYAYQEELWSTNWAEMEEEQIGHQDEEDESNINWNEFKKQRNELNQNSEMYNLGQEMENMGYHFSVFMDGDCQYSNLTPTDTDLLQKVAGDSITHVKSMVVSEENISVIKNTFEKEKTVCVIVAINSGNDSVNIHGISYLKQYVEQFILLFLLVILIVIFITNAALSSLIIKSILPPLEKLRVGAKRIKEGNLDTPIGYESQNEFGEVCHDFDEMRCYLKQSALERLEYEAYRRELISGISHDLRTPLTSIKGYLEGLILGVASDKKMQERYYNAMDIRTKDLERLVDNLSVYNKLENHAIHYQRQVFNLADFLRDYIQERTLELERMKIKIRICASETEYPVFLDPIQMVRVFDNFVSNTGKYRITESSLIFITLDCEGGHILCTYEDDAGGVPQECLSRLFDSFYRVDDSRTRAGDGSGLGLSIVKNIMTLQGGTVTAENGETGLRIAINIARAEDENENISH